MVALWVTITTKGRRPKFKLETAFRNITLIRADGSSTHPTYVCLGEGNYYGIGFKATNFVGHRTKELNFFLFFPEAKLGDKIIIDDFIQSEIKE